MNRLEALKTNIPPCLLVIASAQPTISNTTPVARITLLTFLQHLSKLLSVIRSYGSDALSVRPSVRPSHAGIVSK